MKIRIPKLLPYLLIASFIIACNSKNDNIVEEFYPNGIIKSRIEVKNDKRNGLTQNYNEQGILESTAELVDDKYEGWLTNYNPKTGLVSAKAFYKNDVQNGPAAQYYVNGALYREETYKDGRIDSIVKTYWADGALQAEVFFKKGYPAIGLKEFDKKGKAVEHPHIVVEKIIQLKTTSSVTLKIYLSDKSSKVKYFKGDLEDGKYLSKEAMQLDDENGVVYLQYYVPKNQTVRKNLNIIARTRTSLGNTLVLQKNYNLNVSN